MNALQTPNTMASMLSDISFALDQADERKAVQLIVEGVESHSLPRGRVLLPGLTRHLGSAMTSRVVHTFATHACFYCDDGHSHCEACDGKGWTDEGDVCEECLGLGQAFCEFCDGSGWVTINFVPAGLRMAVVLERLKLAAVALKDALAPLHHPDMKALSLRLVELNRILGVLENAILAVQESIPYDATTEATKAKIVRACVQYGAKVRRALKQVLQVMRQRCLSQVQNGASAGGHGAHAQRRAVFYERVLNRSLGGTRLNHPFIDQAIEETAVEVAP